MVVANLVLLGLNLQGGIAPGLDVSEEILLAAWDKGYADAQRTRNLDGAMNFAKRGIGKIRTSPLREETVSWLYFFHPKLLAYAEGFRARKQYWDDKEKQASRDWLTEMGRAKPRVIMFYGYLAVMPSFGGPGGTIDRRANPRDLEDVRVVLKVGDRIIQPLQQPGNVMQSAGTSTSEYARPNLIYGSSRTTSSGTASGPERHVFASGNAHTTFELHTIERGSQSYDWYLGEFFVAFKIYDEDGKPLIGENEKEIHVTVVQYHGERTAKYKLDEWLKAFK